MTSRLLPGVLAPFVHATVRGRFVGLPVPSRRFSRSLPLFVESSPNLPPEPSFYSLLRNSNFVKIGNLRQCPKTVRARIVHVIDDDLYLDFGGKFKAVCRRPRSKAARYVHGAEVTVALHDLEMTSRFLGAVRDTTLLEADATILGLADVPTVEKEAETVDLTATLSYSGLEDLFEAENENVVETEHQTLDGVDSQNEK